MKALTFKGGVHPLHKLHEGKPLAQNAALKEYAAATVVLPMSQHIGAPCTPCVEVGDEVLMGQVVGTPGAGFGVNGEGFFRLTAFGQRESTREAMQRFADLARTL